MSGTRLYSEQIEQYRDDGYFILTHLIDKHLLGMLCQRIDDLMDGKIHYEGMAFQLDTHTGNYEDVDHNRTDFAGPSRQYRKIKGFEQDDLFLSLFRSEIIRSIAHTFIGPDVSSMRAMLMNKPANGGTLLPFHQDVSSKWPMTGMPELTIWMALDDAPVESGCLEVVAGSHKHGRIGDGHYLDATVEHIFAPIEKRRFVSLKAGEAVIFNCKLLHRSGVNRSPHPRRGMTLCLMDAAIRNTKSGRGYPIIFGETRVN